MTPLVRWIRTLVQVIVAAVPAVPAETAAFHIDAATAGKVTAIAGALVTFVSAVQNVLESKANAPLIGSTPAPWQPPGA